jgi:AcrR family transcriptional regulator
MGRPVKEKSLSRQDVIAAAICCIDQDGASALGVSRVARFLGIKPPAIYKHLESGADLQRATVIELWQQYLTECQQVISERLITINLLKQLGHFTRNFAKTYPARYQVMMQVQLQPSGPEAAVIIQQLLNFLRQTLNPYDLTDTRCDADGECCDLRIHCR